MGKPAFTPGPWHREDRGRVVGSRNGIVCECWSHMGLVEADANEALIAAAPELLAALQMVDGIWSDDTTTHVDPESPVARVRAAIAKAQGEAA